MENSHLQNQKTGKKEKTDLRSFTLVYDLPSNVHYLVIDNNVARCAWVPPVAVLEALTGSIEYKPIPCGSGCIFFELSKKGDSAKLHCVNPAKEISLDNRSENGVL